MWDKEKSNAFEVRKIRNRIVPYLEGTIVDIGCGEEKICAKAIGIDLCDEADIKLDLSYPNALAMFSDNFFDVVFSSHFLEDLVDYKHMLKEMWRILAPNGHLILYLPHKDFYPNMGKDGANVNHKHDFIPEDIINALKEFASFNLISDKTYSEDDEYSFEIIAQKIGADINFNFRSEPKPVKENSVVIVRYGGFGDMIITTPLYRLFKKQGYYVICNTKPEGTIALENNPYIDEFIIQDKYVIPSNRLKEYFEELRRKYGKVVNLCESIERSLLFEERDSELFNLSHRERQKRTNVNYYDRTLELAGLTERGLRPEIYLSDNEKLLCERFSEKHEGFFKVIWQLTGSSWHKLYPYPDIVMETLIDKYPDIKFFLTGDQVAKILGWKHPQICDRIGVWNIRQSIIMPKYMDLVVSPETGVLNAAGAFDTPKIGLLTHSHKYNLTHYFKNDLSIQADVECSPCHRLTTTLEACPLDERYKLPVCMVKGISPSVLIGAIERQYHVWKESRELCPALS